MRALFATEPKYAGAIHFSGHGREGISYPSPIATLLLKSFACAAAAASYILVFQLTACRT